MSIVFLIFLLFTIIIVTYLASRDQLRKDDRFRKLWLENMNFVDEYFPYLSLYDKNTRESAEVIEIKNEILKELGCAAPLRLPDSTGACPKFHYIVDSCCKLDDTGMPEIKKRRSAILTLVVDIMISVVIGAVIGKVVSLVVQTTVAKIVGNIIVQIIARISATIAAQVAVIGAAIASGPGVIIAIVSFVSVILDPLGFSLFKNKENMTIFRNEIECSVIDALEKEGIRGIFIDEVGEYTPLVFPISTVFPEEFDFVREVVEQSMLSGQPIFEEKEYRGKDGKKLVFVKKDGSSISLVSSNDKKFTYKEGGIIAEAISKFSRENPDADMSQEENVEKLMEIVEEIKEKPETCRLRDIYIYKLMVAELAWTESNGSDNPNYGRYDEIELIHDERFSTPGSYAVTLNEKGSDKWNDSHRLTWYSLNHKKLSKDDVDIPPYALYSNQFRVKNYDNPVKHADGDLCLQRVANFNWFGIPGANISNAFGGTPPEYINMKQVNINTPFCQFMPVHGLIMRECEGIVVPGQIIDFLIPSADIQTGDLIYLSKNPSINDSNKNNIHRECGFSFNKETAICDYTVKGCLEFARFLNSEGDDCIMDPLSSCVSDILGPYLTPLGMAIVAKEIGRCLVNIFIDLGDALDGLADAINKSAVGANGTSRIQIMDHEDFETFSTNLDNNWHNTGMSLIEIKDFNKSKALVSGNKCLDVFNGYVRSFGGNIPVFGCHGNSDGKDGEGCVKIMFVNEEILHNDDFSAVCQLSNFVNTQHQN